MVRAELARSACIHRGEAALWHESGRYSVFTGGSPKTVNCTLYSADYVFFPCLHPCNTNIELTQIRGEKNL